MTRDEARKILGEEATEEQITNLLNNYHVQESSKVKELESQINSLKDINEKHSGYDTLKKQLDEINKSKMSEQEKLEADKLATAEALKNANIIYNTAKAKEILAGENLDDELLKTLVSENADDTIARATKMKETLSSIKESVAKQTKESLINVDLKPTISNVNQNEQIMSFDRFSQLSADEQNEWISQHPNEFENLK